MKLALCAVGAFLLSTYIEPPDMCIPQADIDLIKMTDRAVGEGTDAVGHPDSFDIHDARAISQFVDLLTSKRYVPAPKSLDPHFRSPSRYHIRLYAQDRLLLEFDIVAISVLDFPNDPNFYMESSRHSNALLFPLLRLRGK